MGSWPRVAAVALVALCSALAAPRAAEAAGRTVIIEFQPVSDETAGLAFLLYDYVSQQLVEPSGGDIVAGEAVQLYLGRNAADCQDSPTCLQKLGQRFDAPLIVTGRVGRDGTVVRVHMEFFASADGRKLGELKRSFPAGEDAMVGEALRDAIGFAMPDALAVQDALGGSRSPRDDPPPRGDGRARDDRRAERDREADRRSQEADERARRDAEEEQRRRDRVDEQRRQERAERQAIADERRREDAARREAAEERRRDERASSDPRRDDDRRSSRPSGRRGDADPDEAEGLDDEPNRPPGGDKKAMSFSEASRKGMGVSEYRRYSRSGLTYDKWRQRRYRHGRVFSLRLAGGLAAGAIKQLYSTTVHYSAGGPKDEEYAWGTTGNAVSGGFVVGFGFSVADMVEVGFEGGMIVGQQYLRRECTEPAGAQPQCRLGTEIGEASWDGGAAVHALLDPRARVFINPGSQIKFYGGFGVPILIESGFDVPEEVYTDRPTSTLVGIEPAVGVQFDTPGGQGFYIDAPLAILVGLGKADFVEDPNVGYITAAQKEPKPDPARVLFRLNFGGQFRF